MATRYAVKVNGKMVAEVDDRASAVTVVVGFEAGLQHAENHPGERPTIYLEPIEDTDT